MNSAKRTAIVTGAGSGVGQATTRALVKAGYFVVLAGRRWERLEAVRRECDADLTATLAVATDVSEPASVQNLFATARKARERLDVLFNNAGTNVPAVPLEELTIEQWRHVIDINLTGTFLCTQEAFRWMKAQRPQGGRIINNGSVSAQVPRPNTAPTP